MQQLKACLRAQERKKKKCSTKEPSPESEPGCDLDG